VILAVYLTFKHQQRQEPPFHGFLSFSLLLTILGLLFLNFILFIIIVAKFNSAKDSSGKPLKEVHHSAFSSSVYMMIMTLGAFILMIIPLGFSVVSKSNPVQISTVKQPETVIRQVPPYQNSDEAARLLTELQTGARSLSELSKRSVPGVLPTQNI